MSDGRYMLPEKVADALLPINLWATFGRDLLDAMPQKYRDEIGRKAVENAYYEAQLATLNQSRKCRGEPPLTMSEMLAGTDE